jgi:hypothetical protein
MEVDPRSITFEKLHSRRERFDHLPPRPPKRPGLCPGCLTGVKKVRNLCQFRSGSFDLPTSPRAIHRLTLLARIAPSDPLDPRRVIIVSSPAFITTHDYTLCPTPFTTTCAGRVATSPWWTSRARSSASLSKMRTRSMLASGLHSRHRHLSLWLNFSRSARHDSAIPSHSRTSS